MCCSRFDYLHLPSSLLWTLQGDDDVNGTSAAASKQKDTPKEEPVESSPSKPAPSASGKGAPTSSKSKGKRKASGDETKASNGAPPKRVKSETVSNYGCFSTVQLSFTLSCVTSNAT